MEGYEEIMIERGKHNDKAKLDSSMKAYRRQFFMRFDTATHSKSETSYFDIEQCESFARNSANNDYWFCRREISIAHFSDAAANLRLMLLI